jgi:polyisoprenyl-phosphate glycosyltransferase
MKRIGDHRPGHKRRLCVVIPVHNEADNLAELARRLQVVAAQLSAWEMEVLFVDDGSTDASVDTIRDIRAAGIPVGYIRLSKNYGHQAALCAGLEQAFGDAVVTMDSDLQHPPEEIPRMIEAHEAGADVVQMVRSGRAQAGKGLLSASFYWMFNHLSDTPIVPGAADFRLLSRPVLDVLLGIPEREKLLRVLIPSLGFRQTALEFHEAERLHGMPKYSLRMSFRMAHRALFDYSMVPLQFVLWLGASVAVLSFLFGAGLFIYALSNWDKTASGVGTIIAIAAIFFLGGAILASLGILGRYVTILLEQVRRWPPFVIMDQVSGDPLLLPSEAPGEHRDRISIAASP